MIFEKHPEDSSHYRLGDALALDLAFCLGCRLDGLWVWRGGRGELCGSGAVRMEGGRAAGSLAAGSGE